MSMLLQIVYAGLKGRWNKALGNLSILRLYSLLCLVNYEENTVE